MLPSPNKLILNWILIIIGKIKYPIHIRILLTIALPILPTFWAGFWIAYWIIGGLK